MKLYSTTKTFKQTKYIPPKRDLLGLFSVNLQPIGTAESICVSIKDIVSRSLCSKVVVGREFV